MSKDLKAQKKYVSYQKKYQIEYIKALFLKYFRFEIVK